MSNEHEQTTRLLRTAKQASCPEWADRDIALAWKWKTFLGSIMFFISELLLGNPLYNVFLFNHVPPSRRGVVASEGRCPAHILGTCRCNLFNSGAWKSYIITDCIAALSEEKWRGNGWYQEWETVDFCWHLRTLTATWQRQTMLKSFCCCPFQFSAKKEKNWIFGVYKHFLS